MEGWREEHRVVITYEEEGDSGCSSVSELTLLFSLAFVFVLQNVLSAVYICNSCCAVCSPPARTPPFLVVLSFVVPQLSYRFERASVRLFDGSTVPSGHGRRVTHLSLIRRFGDESRRQACFSTCKISSERSSCCWWNGLHIGL